MLDWNAGPWYSPWVGRECRRWETEMTKIETLALNNNIHADETEVARRVAAMIERARPTRDLPLPPASTVTEIDANRRRLRFDRRK